MNIQIGQERLDRELKPLGTYSLEDLTEDAEKWLCNKYKVESIEDLLAAIGTDNIRPHGIAVKLVEYWQQREQKDAKGQEEEQMVALTTTVNTKPADVQALTR